MKKSLIFFTKTETIKEVRCIWKQIQNLYKQDTFYQVVKIFCTGGMKLIRSNKAKAIVTLVV